MGIFRSPFFYTAVELSVPSFATLIRYLVPLGDDRINSLNPRVSSPNEAVLLPPGAIFVVDALNTAPSSASDTGTLGEIRYTTDYIYICIATDTWKRSAIATW